LINQFNLKSKETLKELKTKEKDPFGLERVYFHLPEKIYPQLKKGEMSLIVHASGGQTTIANSNKKTLAILDSQLRSGDDIKDKI
jgi:hypothetical protein